MHLSLVTKLSRGDFSFDLLDFFTFWAPGGVIEKLYKGD